MFHKTLFSCNVWTILFLLGRYIWVGGVFAAQGQDYCFLKSIKLMFFCITEKAGLPSECRDFTPSGRAFIQNDSTFFYG